MKTYLTALATQPAAWGELYYFVKDTAVHGDRRAETPTGRQIDRRADRQEGRQPDYDGRLAGSLTG